ncbi:MAG: hypothetical protein WB763_19855 [Terriglobia bacterium]
MGKACHAKAQRPQSKSGVRQLAAALVPRACSRRRWPTRRAAVHGQQAGLRKSGSKLPHSKVEW